MILLNFNKVLDLYQWLNQKIAHQRIKFQKHIEMEFIEKRDKNMQV